MPRTRIIFIKDLNPETTDRMLAFYFSRFGDIYTGGIFRDRGGPSRRCAFIIFMKPESVDAVLAAKNHQLDRFKIRCQRAFISNYRLSMQARQIKNEPQHMKKLFVARIPRYTTQAELRDYFYDEGGAVLHVQFINNRSKRSTLYAIVLFAKASSVDLVQMTRPHTINNKFIFTRRVFPDNCSAEDRKKTNILYALNYGENIQESDLLKYFEDYGPVKACNNSEDNHGNGYMMFEFEDYDVVDQLCLKGEHHLKVADISFTVQKSKPSPNYIPKEISSTSEDTEESDKVATSEAIPFEMRFIKFVDYDDFKENKNLNLNTARSKNKTSDKSQSQALQNLTDSDMNSKPVWSPSRTSLLHQLEIDPVSKPSGSGLKRKIQQDDKLCGKINQREKFQPVFMSNTSNKQEITYSNGCTTPLVNTPWSINCSSIYRNVANDGSKLKKDKVQASNTTHQRNSNEQRATSRYFKLPIINRPPPYLRRAFRWGKKTKGKNDDLIQVQQSEAIAQLNQPSTSKASLGLLKQAKLAPSLLQRRQNAAINPGTQSSIHDFWPDSASTTVPLLNQLIRNDRFMNVEYPTDEFKSLNLRAKDRESSKNQSVGERSCIWGGVVKFFNRK